MSEQIMNRSAVLDGPYRYALWRAWGSLFDSDGRVCCWIMLNPSTADAEQDDATMRTCIALSKAWGYDRLSVVNLFALRATRPRDLLAHPEPVGPANDGWIVREVGAADLVVAAWGAHGTHRDRAREVTALVAPRLHHLGLTRSGQPRHPLYLPHSTRPHPLERSCHLGACQCGTP